MAATMTKRAFTAGSAQKAAAPTRSRAVRVCCSKQGDNVVQKVQLVAASVAAAALLQVSPASAGVVLEQPQLKKVFQDDAPAAPAPKREIILPGQRSKAAPAAKDAPKAAAPRKVEASSSGSDLDPRSIALPGALVVLAGGAFAWTKLDEDFEEFFRRTSVKDSGVDGAGYEPALKGGNGVVAGGRKSAPGTKKVKAASKSKPGSRTGTTSTSPLSSLFGNKE